MKRLLLTVLSALLIAAPIELTARQVVKHHKAHAQVRGEVPSVQAANPNCAFGAAPPSGTSCDTSDYTAGNTTLGTGDAIQICQKAGGCFGTSTTITRNQVPLLLTIRGSLSATGPISYNPSTGAISCPTCGTSTGGLTGLTVSPGLTVVPGTYNTGTGTAATLVNGSQISPQLFYVAVTATSTTVGATDGGKLFEATVPGVTYTVPAVGAAGSSGYSFSFDGTHSYSITSSSAIYGCGVTTTAGAVGTGAGTLTVQWDVTLIPNGSQWKCSGAENIVYTPLSWGPGMNLATSPTPMIRRSIPVQIFGYGCMAGVVVAGTPASVDLVYCPDGTVGSVPPTGSCGYVATGGTTAPSSTQTCHAGTGTGGGAGVWQGLAGATPVIPANNTIWAVGSGSGWSSANVASSSGMIQLATSP